VVAEVIVNTVEPVPTAVVAATTTWQEFPALWKPMLDEVWSFLRNEAPAELFQHGHNVMLYKDDFPSVEVGVEVTGSFEPSGAIVPSALPGGLVAMAIHRGPIADLGDTYRAVHEWLDRSAHRLAGPHWEIYGHPDPETGEYDIEVVWLLVTE
jgi:effector-binding domain-containing protein